MRPMRLAELLPSRSRILQQRVLGTVATYRVLHQTRSVVQVEVVDAPGLVAGTRLYMTAAATANMQRAPIAVARRATRGARMPARAAISSPT